MTLVPFSSLPEDDQINFLTQYGFEGEVGRIYDDIIEYKYKIIIENAEKLLKNLEKKYPDVIISTNLDLTIDDYTGLYIANSYPEVYVYSETENGIVPKEVAAEYDKAEKESRAIVDNCVKELGNTTDRLEEHYDDLLYVLAADKNTMVDTKTGIIYPNENIIRKYFLK